MNPFDSYRLNKVRRLKRGALVVALFFAVCSAQGGSISVEKLWCTRSLPAKDGYTWTMTSRLGHMLAAAERMFGERDRRWTILGVEMCMDEDQPPQNWYPGYPARTNIIIQIVPAQDERFACYQLAHEVVHTLAPQVGTPANVLEEGVAVWFARRYVKDNFDFNIDAGRPSYDDACKLVDQMLSRDEQAIRKLRSVEPLFKRMTIQTFRKAGVVCPTDDMEKLLAPFIR